MKFLTAIALASIMLSAQAGSVLTIRHKVQDFAKWKEAFDADKPYREAAGLSNERVLETDGKTGDVTLISDASDEAKAREFSNSERLKGVMKSAGVVGKPEIHYLSDKL